MVERIYADSLNSGKLTLCYRSQPIFFLYRSVRALSPEFMRTPSHVDKINVTAVSLFTFLLFHPVITCYPCIEQRIYADSLQCRGNLCEATLSA
jgi:hypothetical protein